MSLSIDIANAMANRLTEDEQFAGLTVLVWRKKSLESEMNVALGKVSGAVAVILYTGFTQSGARSGGPDVKRRYTLSLFCRPLLADGTDPEETTEKITRTLNDWDPDEEVVPGFIEIEVNACDLRPDDKMLIYDMEIEVTSRL